MATNCISCVEFESKCELCGTFVHLVVDPYLGINPIWIWHHIETEPHSIHVALCRLRKSEKVKRVIIKCWEMFINAITEWDSFARRLFNPISHCSLHMICHHLKSRNPRVPICGSVADLMMMRLKKPQTFHYYGPFVF